jgi:hypothetical protein
MGMAVFFYSKYEFSGCIFPPVLTLVSFDLPVMCLGRREARLGASVSFACIVCRNAYYCLPKQLNLASK